MTHNSTCLKCRLFHLYIGLTTFKTSGYYNAKKIFCLIRVHSIYAHYSYIPQGTVIGHALFNIQIGDFGLFCSESVCRQIHYLRII